jgi:hypothetical protein
VAHLAIAARDAEGRYPYESPDTMTPDLFYERTWALTLLERVLDLRSREYETSGQSETFESIRVGLAEGRGLDSGATLAEGLGIAEDAVYAAIHQLKARHRSILERDVAATLDDPVGVDAEIRFLIAAVSVRTIGPS